MPPGMSPVVFANHGDAGIAKPACPRETVPKNRIPVR
jgi:hypothetical protein